MTRRGLVDGFLDTEGVDLQVQIILEHNMHVIINIMHSDCRIAERRSVQTFTATFLTTYAKNAEVGRCVIALRCQIPTLPPAESYALCVYLLCKLSSSSCLTYQHLYLVLYVPRSESTTTAMAPRKLIIDTDPVRKLIMIHSIL
jgi:hypothetical protein